MGLLKSCDVQGPCPGCVGVLVKVEDVEDVASTVFVWILNLVCGQVPANHHSLPTIKAFDF